VSSRIIITLFSVFIAKGLFSHWGFVRERRRKKRKAVRKKRSKNSRIFNQANRSRFVSRRKKREEKKILFRRIRWRR
jgi:CelD/BcsL family acetyltransferase involved in cellulose biosynthesis